MTFRLGDRAFVRALMVGGVVLALAGCQSSGGDGAPGDGTSDAPPPPGKVKQSDLRAYCPRVTLREGTAYFTTYAKGAENDATKVLYQASIGDVTRSCTRADGQLTMNVAVAGKIVPGPAGAPGSITMPIRVAVLGGGGVVLYSQLHRYQVAVSDASTATQFVFNDPNVVIPDPGETRVQVFAGYDEGQPAAAKPETKKRRRK